MIIRKVKTRLLTKFKVKIYITAKNNLINLF